MRAACHGSRTVHNRNKRVDNLYVAHRLVKFTVKLIIILSSEIHGPGHKVATLLHNTYIHTNIYSVCLCILAQIHSIHSLDAFMSTMNHIPLILRSSLGTYYVITIYYPIVSTDKISVFKSYLHVQKKTKQNKLLVTITKTTTNTK